MFESLIGTVAILALIVFVARQHSRLGMLEREIGALRSFVLASPPVADAAKAAAISPDDAPEVTATTVTGTAPEAPEAASAAVVSDQVGAGPWSMQAAPAVVEPTEPANVPVSPKRPDIETALGTRWAVWVGGVALALGGVFLIRYSIEAGIFGPAVRLTMAGLLGLVLVGVGEFIRRTGYKLPVEGAAGAYVPGILSAAGAFTLFGTVYAAHGLYGFIGPTLAFTLLGIIGLGTIAAALVHGQALAGVGLLGSMITPALVSSQSPNAWSLFGYLAIVLAAIVAVARLRDWKFLAAAGFAGAGLWCLLYMSDVAIVDFTIVMFINVVTLGALTFVWLGPWPKADVAGTARDFDWPTIVPAVFVALVALALLVKPGFVAAGSEVHGAILIAALVAIALYRKAALPLLYAAGAATVVHARLGLGGSLTIAMMGDELTIDGLPVVAQSSSSVWVGAVLAAIFLAAGYFSARKLAGAAPNRSAAWAGWGTLVPLSVVAALWLTYGNLDQDFVYAAATLVLVTVFVAGGEAIARREEPPLQGGLAVAFAFAGAGIAAVLMLHMAFGGLWTTMLIGAAAVLPALATRWRTYPVLGWLSVGAVIVVMGRVAIDPTIVGAMFLGKTPVFNALLPGYGIPALAFGFAAWQLARTTSGRPRLAMEAAAALFALLTLAMLVRHGMNGGVINADAPTLAEQAIYTLIAIGAGAILVALDMRSPSSVLRIGSLAAGVVSVVLIVAQHFLLLNPLFTDESTGKIPVFNLLFLAYLLPAVAAAALALYARGKRPKWYSAMLGLLASVLAFVYATLSVRRLFQGEHIALWAGMSQLETYSYSALWLAMGVGLLVAGVLLKSQVLRVASAALIATAVAKVFIFDMSELEGVLRALSFIGLGAVLIGIGLFYQRLLTVAAKRAE